MRFEVDPLNADVHGFFSEFVDLRVRGGVWVVDVVVEEGPVENGLHFHGAHLDGGSESMGGGEVLVVKFKRWGEIFVPVN